MLVTPIEMWRAGFVWWTKAAEAQMEIAQFWMCGWMRWEHETERAGAKKAGAEAIEAAARVPAMAPAAVSAPRPKAQLRGVSLKPVPSAVKSAPKRPSAR